MELLNLALGKKTEITPFVPMQKSYASVEKGNKNALTDGLTADPADYYGGGWAHFYRGFGRSIVIDLENTFAVCGFEAGFIHDRGAGIYCPEKIRLLLSEDGKDFFTVSEVDAPYPASFASNVRAVYSFEGEKLYRARYAMLKFDVDVNAFCDEIKIIGKADDENTLSLCGEPEREAFKNSFAPLNSLGGVRDLPLVYFGYWPENEHIAKSNKQELLPYVAYIDKNGKITDTMFDSLLFLFVQGRCPSGGCTGYHGGPSLLSDWEYLMDVLFEKDYSLSALDQAYAETKSALALPADKKLKVYLTAPVPKISLEPFGDMNGDGIEEKLLSTDDCIDAYLWYVDEVTRRFEASGFENLEIDGWFWINESVSRATRDDEEYFATRCVKGLHDRGYKCVFIPYFQAGGADKAEKIGFDCVTMQPNLSFNKPLQLDPAGAMEDFVDACKKYGYGIELEIHHGVKNQETKKLYGEYFYEYMRSGIKSGMMTDSVHTYYQCAGPGVFYDCAISSDEYLRGIYDNLYKFIKGRLTLSDLEPKKEESTPEETPEPQPEPEATPEILNYTIPDMPCYDGETLSENPKRTVRIRKKKKPISDKSKKLLLGAGVAAAVVGLAYLLGRKKGKK
ncbi:MAG: DUF4855 domain-containing protein [Clostridia bacterium]|nr:DUF4855 domain-containing protein [Clostridia bacterium]